jgi:hypothetical protein
VTLDAAAGHREAKLAAMGLAGVEVKANQSQPADGQVFQYMAHLEDAQHAAGEIAPRIHRRAGVLKLQRAFTRHTQPGCAQIVARRLPIALQRQRVIDERTDLLMKFRTVIEVQHHDRPCCRPAAWMAMRCSRNCRSRAAMRSCSSSMLSWYWVTTTSMSVSTSSRL